ncbi:GNAT family N-acetyltransferase [Sporosarcina thermotolerans]|uniref:GNAT family N-acetyltransferase n=1 Tax=Sporosarcina thermotolerans TaxID=633404 RepID=A0AAW9A7E9_9BACL|nr:GNAT family N-acetyltransferase [Sporosarcina thermotolerans]MDW0117526.1 GNAT family N-acetyltransferase [Sporosarcina thermotolerans]WHT49689.1 GNAT family N-acetyltransferase [Sporosarcina thermotolerans]
MIRLLTKSDLEQAASLVAMAYPGMQLSGEEAQKAFIERLTIEIESQNNLKFYGLFNEQNELLGLYKLHKLNGNVNGEIVRIWGIGMVAVHFFHKKEGIAKQLLQHFHELARQENVGIVSLYPFNTSFYQKMGYGYGPTRYQYKLKPASFPNSGDRKKVVMLSAAEEEKIVAVYNEFVSMHHGMMERTWHERNVIKKKVSHYAGVYEGDALVGALAYTLQPVKDSHFLHHDMNILEWVWTKPSAFVDMCTWIHSQQDQVDRVYVRTHDESLIYHFDDPRNDSNRLIPSVYHEIGTVGTGIMYRISSIESFVQQTNFNSLNRPESPVTISIFLKDSFIQEQNGRYQLTFSEDTWSIEKSFDSIEDVDLSIAVSDLSSWWMGCVSMEQLVQYGKVEVNNWPAKQLDRWFMPTTKPVCLTSF